MRLALCLQRGKLRLRQLLAHAVVFGLLALEVGHALRRARAINEELGDDREDEERDEEQDQARAHADALQVAGDFLPDLGLLLGRQRYPRADVDATGADVEHEARGLASGMCRVRRLAS